MPHPLLLIGIGNDYRSDDAVGLVVARALQAKRLSSVSVQEATGEGTALLEVWRGYEAVMVVDAVTSGAPAGTIHRVDAQTGPLSPALLARSTHAFGVAQAVELARVLGTLPQRLLLYGIEGQQFVAGTGLSPEVERAAHKAIKQITHLLERW